MKIAVDVGTMRESDRLTIQNGTPSAELMLRAGKGIYEALSEWGKTAVVCGVGNNAGDGYVLALFLAENGNEVKLFLSEEKFSPDGRFYFEKCMQKNIPFELVTENTSLCGFDTVADCIFGTGFHGKARGNELLCIQKINGSGAFVVSADINSGLCGQSGVSYGECVRSDVTVSIGFYKPGHFLGAAKDNIKNLVNIDIGIKLYGKEIFVPERHDFRDIFYPRKNDCHKGSFGYVAIIGGCTEYCGAVKLANLSASALKCGCGVVKLCTPASCTCAVTPYLLESTYFPMPDRDGKMCFCPEKLDELLKATRAVSVGMGWGQGEDNQKILSYILENYSGTVIIDADGINTLAKMGLPKDLACKKVILTPHPLEFSRLSGLSVDSILSDPVKSASDFVKDFDGRVILLLKGTSTVICDGSETYISETGSPAMATAGSGDVLSGILTGIMGYNEPTAKAVACGAYVAGLAGALACDSVGEISSTASDTVSFLPEAIKSMCG